MYNVYSWHRRLTLENHLVRAANHSRVIHNSFVISRIKFADNAARHSHSTVVSPFFRAEGNLESTTARNNGNAGRQTDADGEKAAATLERPTLRQAPGTSDGRNIYSIFGDVRKFVPLMDRYVGVVDFQYNLQTPEVY